MRSGMIMPFKRGVDRTTGLPEDGRPGLPQGADSRQGPLGTIPTRDGRGAIFFSLASLRAQQHVLPFRHPWHLQWCSEEAEGDSSGAEREEARALSAQTIARKRTTAIGQGRRRDNRHS
jgi:hypothetical protein